jgi:hypothetical protein
MPVVLHGLATIDAQLLLSKMQHGTCIVQLGPFPAISQTRSVLQHPFGIGEASPTVDLSSPLSRPNGPLEA